MKWESVTLSSNGKHCNVLLSSELHYLFKNSKMDGKQDSSDYIFDIMVIMRAAPSNYLSVGTAPVHSKTSIEPKELITGLFNEQVLV